MPNETWSWTTATMMTIAPTRQSTACQILISRTLTRTWASSGFVRTKSSVPCRMSSINRIMFGWMIVAMTPPMRMWTPITARSSGCVQPFRLVVWPNTRASTASPVPAAIADWKSWTAKFARYWSSLSAPTRKNRPASTNGRSGSRPAISRCPPSAADRRVPPDREPPDDPHPDRPDHDPQELHREPAEQLRVGQMTDERLDRVPECPLERQDVRQPLGPIRHERERHEPAGKQELRGEHELEDRPDPSRPERRHPEDPVGHRPDEIRAPDRDGEHGDVDGTDVQLR